MMEMFPLSWRPSWVTWPNPILFTPFTIWCILAETRTLHRLRTGSPTTGSKQTGDWAKLHKLRLGSLLTFLLLLWSIQSHNNDDAGNKYYSNTDTHTHTHRSVLSLSHTHRSVSSFHTILQNTPPPMVSLSSSHFPVSGPCVSQRLMCLGVGEGDEGHIGNVTRPPLSFNTEMNSWGLSKYFSNAFLTYSFFEVISDLTWLNWLSSGREGKDTFSNGSVASFQA